MKEYFFESQIAKDHPRDPFAVPFDLFKQINEHMVIPTHDVMIKYLGGILLVQRENVPAKGDLFPIGGKLIKGVPTLDSLRMRTKQECGLELENIEQVGTARHFWDEDPFGHGKGVDTISEMFYAEGKGEIKLDSLHSTPTLVVSKTFLYRNPNTRFENPEFNYEVNLPKFRETLNPWVKDFFELIMEKNL